MTRKKTVRTKKRDVFEQAPEILQSEPGFQWSAFAILATAFAMAIAVLCLIPRREVDLYWQLRAGRDILASHHVPSEDSYSWTRNGQPWAAHDWLAFVLFSTADAIGGLTAVFTLKVLIASATTIVLFRHLIWAARQRLVYASILTTLAMLLMSLGFEMRPHIFSYLCLAITSGMILRMRGSSYAEHKIWLLIPVFVLWANLHSGMVFGLILLSIWTVGDFVDGARASDAKDKEVTKKRATRLAFITITCGAATLLTPFNTWTFEQILSNARLADLSYGENILLSPSLHNAPGLAFYSLVLILLIGIMAARRSIALGDMIVFTYTLHFALVSQSDVAAFAIVGSMIAAPYVFKLADSYFSGSRLQEDSSKPQISGTSLMWLCPTALISTFIAFALSSTPLIRWTPRFPTNSKVVAQSNVFVHSISDDGEPRHTIQFIRSSPFPRNWKMYNDPQDGSYLIGLLPSFPVFVDTRTGLYDDSLIADALTIGTGDYGWDVDIDKYPVDFAICRANSGDAITFMSSMDWALVYSANSNPDVSQAFNSDNSLVFIRRSPGNVNVIQNLRNRCPALSSSRFQSIYGLYNAVH